MKYVSSFFLMNLKVIGSLFIVFMYKPGCLGNFICANSSCSQTFFVPENMPVGTHVGRIGHTPGSLPFREFFSTGNNVADAKQVFLLDRRTGDLTIRSTLDRELMPDGYVFILTSSDDNYPPTIVTVRLLDVNDNSPSFISTSMHLTFSESVPIGTKQSLGTVTDLDSGTNSTERCEIMSGNILNAFSLQHRQSGEHDMILDVIVNKKLDFEEVSLYDLVIRATDGGGKTGEMNASIEVLDQNDNQPVFVTSKYEVSLDENVMVGTSVVQVEATDLDSGSNGNIRYAIVARTNSKNHFIINADTGLISVNKPLDYESQFFYTLTIEAIDNGPGHLVGVAALDIKLNNVNEQPANIHLTYLQDDSRHGHILENTVAGALVARISIDDPDITFDKTINVTVDLLGGDNVFGLLWTNRDLSLVVVSEAPDRELKSIYNLTIVVSDTGTPPLLASESFSVIIDDVNDNAPVFSTDRYRCEVQVTAEKGTSVQRVTASDPDEGHNSKLFYAIQSSSYSAWFNVDNSTGLITTRQVIDCEATSKASLVVTATDGGSPSLSGSTTVDIFVRDVNERQPEFDVSFYSAKVPEDYGIGGCPVQVTATDLECGRSSGLIYYDVVQDDTDTTRVFAVNETTGFVCVESPGLDFEKHASYEFLVRARDSDGLSASAVVQIIVTDKNDNRPTFEPSHYTFNLNASISPGPLLTVQAYDLDSGLYGTVSYAFVDYIDFGHFYVDAGSGTVYLRRPLPQGVNRVYTLWVQATDKGALASETPAQVSIRVYNGLVSPPVFKQTMYNFAVSEDVEINTLIGQVEATVRQDRSLMTNLAEGVTYTIAYSSWDWFRVDKRSGKIYSTFLLDRETVQFVLLHVIAQTMEPMVLYSTTQVNVTLQDVNDNAPYFSVLNMRCIEIREETFYRNPIYIVQAWDEDLDDNSSLSYSLNSETQFFIDEISGEIVLHSMLDYEKRTSYELVVVAKDNGPAVRQLKSSFNLTVNVLDINDNVPVFSENVYNFYINEDAEIGTEFGMVSAVDADSHYNGRVSYTLEAASPYLSQFGILIVQGILSTRDALDREKQDLYTVIGVARDHGSPKPFSATTFIYIHVTDTNDNSPEFSRSQYMFNVLENQTEQIVGKVIAMDRDTGYNQLLRYFISPTQTKFHINSHTGEITSIGRLDREEIEDYSLSVFATDSGDPKLSSSAIVAVKILDVNDNAPEFLLRGTVVETVLENQPKGIRIIKVRCRDADDGENGMVSYSFDPVRTDADGLINFSIHPNDGWINTKRVLDFEYKSQYHLNVIAADHGHPQLSSHLDIVINVDDGSDAVRVSDGTSINFYVAENVDIGTIVGNVQLDVVNGNSSSKFYLTGGNLLNLFHIETTSGIIKTCGWIDFEETSSHTINVLAVNSEAGIQKNTNITVQILVVDINDNRPEFFSDPIFLDPISENVTIKNVVYTFNATDKDSAENGSVRYAIVSEKTSGCKSDRGFYFHVDKFTGKLSVQRVFNFEKVHSVLIIIQATDNCPLLSCELSSRVTAIVQIIDVNDNVPLFISSPILNLNEDVPVGYPAMMIAALDDDSNNQNSGNNVIKYCIKSGNEDEKFDLHRDTGILTIVERLDREAHGFYTLNISAEDCGVPMKVSYQLLQIIVADVNDNYPTFQHSEYQVHLVESTVIGSTVVTVQATDRDEGANGDVTYSILQGMAEDKFHVHPKTGTITTTHLLDREEKSYYFLAVHVVDSGYPALQNDVRVDVQVTDVNDHLPVFSRPKYYLNIPENLAQEAITAIVAADEDSGENSRISYSIFGDDTHFSINSISGTLSCVVLDREVRPNYTLVVMATDGGSTPRSGTTTVMVTVLDDNDNCPVFQHDLYSVVIPENTAKGHLVTAVSASDADHGQNALVSYGLKGIDTLGLFSINSSSGHLLVSGVLDREKNASFDLTIIAVDRSMSGPLSSETRVHIILSDTNDNAPVFCDTSYNITLPRSTGRGQMILQVRGEDADEGENGRIRYRLLSTNTADTLAFFRIQPSTGLITTKQSLSLGSLRHHSLLVVASDFGNNALSTTGVVEITVGDEYPKFQFSQAAYVKEIAENSPLDTSIVLLSAVNHYEAIVVYSFVNGNSQQTFKINQQGLVQVANSSLIDYESIVQMELIVRGVAEGNQAYARIIIKITDENDNKPRFAQDQYVSAIFENNAPLSEVTQVFAVDDDRGANGEIDYTIIAGNVDNVFEIHPPSSGIIRTRVDASSLDREVRPSYTLFVEARDYGYPSSLSAMCAVIITVVDENDNEPKFPSSQMIRVSIPENSPPGTALMTVTATDVDLNPLLIYDFKSQGNPNQIFSMDHFNGEIFLATTLNYEERSQYTLEIQAFDGKHTRTTTVEVDVIDINDNAPNFSRHSYYKSISEFTDVGQSVLTVKAWDGDKGDNAVVTYTLIDPSLSFVVDSMKGTIYTEKTFDVSIQRDTTKRFTVIARDGGTPPLYSSASVQIDIVAGTKAKPQFSQEFYKVNISELQRKGSEVFRLSVNDTNRTSHFDGNFQYYLQRTSHDNFFVNSGTGVITLSSPLDRELSNLYSLTVCIVGQGDPSSNMSFSLLVNVLDYNDCPPLFDEHQYYVTLKENHVLHAVFLKLNVTDSDEAANAEVTFSITSGNDEGIFHIDRAGQLSLLSELNFEANHRHRLIVRAEDCLSCPICVGRFSDVTSVFINVTDVNEFAPQFPLQHYFKTVAENLTTYLTVFQVHAVDLDGGVYGDLTYAILPGGDRELFSINMKTGDVITRKTFDYENAQEHKEYNLTLLATDQGHLADTVGVTIKVTDHDEFRPTFLSTNGYSFTIPGSATSGFYVGTVTAVDLDTGEAGSLIYVLTDKSDYFKIDWKSGNITVSHTLNKDDIGEKLGSEAPLSMKERRKRALRKNSETLIVKVSSGMEHSRFDKALCVIEIDRSCTGCLPPPLPYSADSSALGKVVVAMIIFACLLTPLAVTVSIFLFLLKRKKLKGSAGTPNCVAYGGIDAACPNSFYADIRAIPPSYNQAVKNGDNTCGMTSVGSDQSASSGRGSAEDGYDEVEVKIITSNSITNSSAFVQWTLPEDASWHAKETFSEHLEPYDNRNYPTDVSNDMVSTNMTKKYDKFVGTCDGDTIQRLNQNICMCDNDCEIKNRMALERVTEADVDEEIAMFEDRRKPLHNQSQKNNVDPVQATELQGKSPLSVIFNNEEEIYNLSHLKYMLDWTQQCHTLSDVFAEIARLRDETVCPEETIEKTSQHQSLNKGERLSLSQNYFLTSSISSNNFISLPVLDADPVDNKSVLAGSDRKNDSCDGFVNSLVSSNTHFYEADYNVNDYGFPPVDVSSDKAPHASASLYPISTSVRDLPSMIQHQCNYDVHLNHYMECNCVTLGPDVNVDLMPTIEELCNHDCGKRIQNLVNPQNSSNHTDIHNQNVDSCEENINSIFKYRIIGNSPVCTFTEHQKWFKI